MPRPLLIFSQSDYLIQVVDTSLYIQWQTVQILITWLLQQIWVYTFCKDITCPDSAGPGLRIADVAYSKSIHASIESQALEQVVWKTFYHMTVKLFSETTHVIKII